MSDENGSPGGTDGGPAAPRIGRSRGFSPIWLIPIAALLVAGSMAWRAIADRGVEVAVVFESAQGITAGKSVVKYRDVQIGTVDAIRLTDPSHVELRLRIDEGAAAYLTEGAQWWVVRPRIGIGGISGLGTVISGSYVTLEPGVPGRPERRKFTGLESPPLPASERPGLHVKLHTDDLGGITAGSPVLFRDVHVGDVSGYQLAPDGKWVIVDAVVETTHAGLVKRTSRFWNASGIDVSLGAGGVRVDTESLEALIVGGVAFDSPEGGDAAAAGDAYFLYPSHSEAHAQALAYGGLGLVLESKSLGGLATGDSVSYRELPVGTVVSTELSSDGSVVRTRINIERRYASLVRSNSVFWNASGISAELSLHGLEVQAESLKSLVSGGVEFATPDAPGKKVSEGSVFLLHAKAKKGWRDWTADFGPGTDDPAGTEGGAFFHHQGKTEEAAAKDDPTPEPTPVEHKHRLLRDLFHHGS